MPVYIKNVSSLMFLCSIIGLLIERLRHEQITFFQRVEFFEENFHHHLNNIVTFLKRTTPTPSILNLCGNWIMSQLTKGVKLPPSFLIQKKFLYKDIYIFLSQWNHQYLGILRVPRLELEISS